MCLHQPRCSAQSVAARNKKTKCGHGGRPTGRGTEDKAPRYELNNAQRRDRGEAELAAAGLLRGDHIVVVFFFFFFFIPYFFNFLKQKPRGEIELQR